MAVVGPTGSPPWRRGAHSAKGPVPDRPRSPRFPPTRPRTCRCYRDTLFWRCFRPVNSIIGIKRVTLEEKSAQLIRHIVVARHTIAVSQRSSLHPPWYRYRAALKLSTCRPIVSRLFTNALLYLLTKILIRLRPLST